MGRQRILFLLLIIFFQTIFSQEGKLEIQAYVTDKASLFSSEEITALRNKLRNFEKETTHQIIVVTIKSLEGETIESFANTLFNETKIGQEGKNNGVLLLISKNDRKL